MSLAASAQLGRREMGQLVLFGGVPRAVLEARRSGAVRLAGGDDRVAALARAGAGDRAAAPGSVGAVGGGREGAGDPSGYYHGADNGREVLTCLRADDPRCPAVSARDAGAGYIEGPAWARRVDGVCRETLDPSDRAHRHRLGGDGAMLLPATACPASATRARRYPGHQFTSRGGTFEQANDELAERERRLVAMGLGRVRAGEVRGGGELSTVESLALAHGIGRLRDVVDTNHAAFGRAGGGELERAGTAWLRERGYTAMGREVRPLPEGEGGE